MANLTNAAALIGSQEFRLRVALACVEAATDIMAEDPQTAGHAERKTLANAVLLDPMGKSLPFVFTTASNDTISAAGSATDNDIAFAVASTWNAVAGV